MSNTTLIIGGSGTGKSTSIRNLNPNETFIISVLNKPLPFKGYKKNYIPIKSWDDKENNYYVTDDWVKIVKCIKLVNERTDIKNLILDDIGYVMSGEYMRRSSEKGYEKYSELASHIWLIFQEIIGTRNDLYCFVFAHNEPDNTGFMKIKTIGKLLDEKITLEGMFTIVLHSMIVDEEYKFLTQNNGTHLAKSPFEMFTEKYINNDLAYVRECMINYYNDGE